MTTPRTPLVLSHYLTPASILVIPEHSTKEEIFHRIIGQLVEVNHLSPLEKFTEAIWDREKEGRTVLENGLAIPHARVPGLTEVKACMGIIPEGYLDIQTQILVKVVILFFSPQEQFENHLQMLAKISRLFQDPRLLTQILASGSPEKAFAFLQKQEEI